MVNGLPGNMAREIVKKALPDSRFCVIPYSLTGPDIDESSVKIDSLDISLIKPDKKDSFLSDHTELMQSVIVIDYTHPTAVDSNCQWYYTNHIHFVLGTTGGNREQIIRAVKSSDICAVIAPNMGKQIVAFQAMMAFLAKEYPSLFNGYTMEITESHQRGKADISGTARSLIPDFQKMGIDVHEHDIFMERNPEIQHHQLGVPEQFLDGHAWHTYTLVSDDQTVTFQFTHNVNGRSVYVQGTLDAVRYLNQKVMEKNQGQVYSMVDVLKGI